MYGIVTTATVCGIESILIQAEADVCDGMPIFEMVGVLASEVREAKERIKAAIRNSGIRLAPKRITVNLYPADIRKTGTGFDLPIALAVLSAYGMIPRAWVEGVMAAGEISLNGALHPINGVLPIVLAAKAAGMKTVCVPRANAAEAAMVKGIAVLAADSLGQVLELLAPQNQQDIVPLKTQYNIEETQQETMGEASDFAQIHGQRVLKRACEIAAAGRHNLLMIGAPGAGKTMAARAIPSILPRLTEEEAMELARVYSVSGMFEKRRADFWKRPFRGPHHTITPSGLAGGGRNPKPGEISLAHKGVLFLDELTEFNRTTLEILRQPLEERSIQIVRSSGTYCYPADFMLVAAMNPCNCGYYPDRSKCACSQTVIDRHLNKISKPLVDRMDLCVEARRVHLKELIQTEREEGSETIRSRVERVQRIQHKRFQKESIWYNSQIPVLSMERYCPMEKKAQQMMEQVFEELELSARGYYKIIRVARTIADLSGEDAIQGKHIAESLIYRNIDRNMWGGCV